MAYDFSKVVKIGSKILMSKGGLVVPRVNEEPTIELPDNTVRFKFSIPMSMSDLPTDSRFLINKVDDYTYDYTCEYPSTAAWFENKFNDDSYTVNCIAMGKLNNIGSWTCNSMFSGCSSLTNFEPILDLSNVEQIASMFKGTNLLKIPKLIVDYEKLVNIRYVFNELYKASEGILDAYNVLKQCINLEDFSYAKPFMFCGVDENGNYASEQAKVELQQIPESWGGLKIELPAQTIRFRFENTDYDPTVIENGGTWTKVTGSTFNDWNWYCEDTDWSYKFDNDKGRAFTGDNKTSIIAIGDTSNVTNGTAMFRGCASLTSIPDNAFTNLTNGTVMFYDCTGLTSISDNVFPNLTNGTSMFHGCTSLTNIPDNAFPSLTGCTAIFQNCTSLTSIPDNAFPNLTNGTAIFYGCTGLTSIPENAFPSLTECTSMFNGCTGLTNIPENAFQNLTKNTAMFQNCTGLISIPENAFQNLTQSIYMFYGCTNVQSGALGLYRNLLAGGKVTSYGNTFTNCGKETTTGLAELQQIPQSWGGLAAG